MADDVWRTWGRPLSPATGALGEPYQRKLRARCYRMLGCYDDAEEQRSWC